MFNNYFNTKKKRIIFIISLSILILLFSFFYYKFYTLFNIGIPCIFHKITNYYCPGCGITRAIFSLISLDIKAAIEYNLLILLVFPFVGYYIIIKIKNWINFKNDYNCVFSNKFWNFLLIVTVMFGILRNVDLFSFLAP